MYSIHATPAKIDSQSKKARLSTSEEMGVRLCGMQVWRDTVYEYMDKYAGRLVKSSGFLDVIQTFLRDGLDVKGLLSRLTMIEVLIRRYPKMRLYSSSLLFVYDAVGSSNKIYVWMIDFANAVGWKDGEIVGGACPVEGGGGPDEGYLKGLKSLRDVFSGLC